MTNRPAIYVVPSRNGSGEYAAFCQHLRARVDTVDAREPGALIKDGRNALVLSTDLGAEELTALRSKAPHCSLVHVSGLSSVEVALKNGPLFLAADACLSWTDHPLSVDLILKLYEALTRGDLRIDALALAGGAIEKRVLTSLHAQYPAIEALGAALEAANVRDYHRSAFVDATVELITNALYDAPADADGKALRYDDADRSKDAALAGRELVELRWVVGERYLIAGVADHYGRLRPKHILQVLTKCYDAGKGAGSTLNSVVNTSAKGGANIGFFTVVSKVSGLVVTVDPGVFTEVSCIIDRAASRKDMRIYPRLIVFKERG